MILFKFRKESGTEDLSTSEKLFFDNETRTNVMAARCMLVLIFILVIFGIITLSGITRTISEWTGWLLIAVSIIELVSYALIRVIGYESPHTKYLVLVNIIIISAVIYFLYPLTIVFIMFGPILISIKYYEPKLVIKTMFMSWIIFVIATIANIYLEKTSEAIYLVHDEQGYMWNHTTLYYIKYYFTPRTISYIIEAAIGYRIAKAGRNLVNDQAETITKSAFMSAELSTASKIQSASLPDANYTTPDGHIDVSAFVRTARDVGGDFFDYFMINDHLLVALVADVSDKGLPSAMYGVEAQSYVRFAFSESFSKDVNGDIEFVNLSSALNAVNRQLAIHNMDSMFVTMWIACIDTRTGVGKYINAGHTLPYVRHADGTVTKLENEPQFFLGTFKDADLKAKAMRLRAGDTLLMYTDGATDARNGADETFGLERLEGAIAGEGAGNTESAGVGAESTWQTGSGAEAVVNAVKAEIESFVGDEALYDDVTLLAVHFNTEYHSKRVEREFTTGPECATQVMDFVNENLEDRRFTDDFRRNLDVIIDEIADNKTCYAYGEGKTGPLVVGLHIGDNYISMRFIDSGNAFNPHDVKTPDIENAEPQIGGLGIYLVGNLSDDVKYKYKDGKNMLTVFSVWNM